jgi:hypothetical protein
MKPVAGYAVTVPDGIDRSGCPAPRHGEYWMAVNYGCVCFDTKVAYSAYRRAKHQGLRRVVDATAATRICQGLPHYGYTAEQIAGMSGVSERLVRELQAGGKETVLRSRDEMLRHAAARARIDVQPQSSAASCARRVARRHGWVPLAAWDDETIGDPNAVPDLGDGVSDEVDEVAVARAARGERVRLTAVEKAAALRLGVDRGDPLSRVSARLGINYADARRMVGVDMSPRREQQLRVEAELARVGDIHNDFTIGALLGVHHQTVTRARRRLARRQEQLAS